MHQPEWRRGAQRLLNDITSHFLGSIIIIGEETMFPLSTFFYISALLFLYNPTSFNRQTDLFRLVIDCSRDFVGGFHPTSYNTTISSAVYFYLQSSYGGRSARVIHSYSRSLLRVEFIMFERFITDQYFNLINLSTCMFTIPSSAVYSYSMLSRFAPSLASPVYSYGVSADLHFMRFIIMSLFTLLIIVSFSIGDGKSMT